MELCLCAAILPNIAPKVRDLELTIISGIHATSVRIGDSQAESPGEHASVIKICQRFDRGFELFRSFIGTEEAIYGSFLCIESLGV